MDDFKIKKDEKKEENAFDKYKALMKSKLDKDLLSNMKRVGLAGEDYNQFAEMLALRKKEIDDATTQAGIVRCLNRVMAASGTLLTNLTKPINDKDASGVGYAEGRRKNVLNVEVPTQLSIFYKDSVVPEQKKLDKTPKKQLMEAESTIDNKLKKSTIRLLENYLSSQKGWRARFKLRSQDPALLRARRQLVETCLEKLDQPMTRDDVEALLLQLQRDNNAATEAYSSREETINIASSSRDVDAAQIAEKKTVLVKSLVGAERLNMALDAHIKRFVQPEHVKNRDNLSTPSSPKSPRG
jgi:hypothetical protein